MFGGGLGRGFNQHSTQPYKQRTCPLLWIHASLKFHMHTRTHNDLYISSTTTCHSWSPTLSTFHFQISQPNSIIKNNASAAFKAQWLVGTSSRYTWPVVASVHNLYLENRGLCSINGLKMILITYGASQLKMYCMKGVFTLLEKLQRYLYVARKDTTRCILRKYKTSIN